MEKLRASGIRVEIKKAPVSKGGVHKPSVPRVPTRQSVITVGTRKKSHNPHPNLQAFKSRLSGCPVSVSLSQSVTENPQVIQKVISSQSTYVSEYLDWCRKTKEARVEPDNVAADVQAESVDSNADSATLTADSDDGMDDPVKAAADVHADSWGGSGTW